MFFTNSIFLVGLIFAVIPLILHLIFKKKSKIIYFSAVIFIKNILKSEAKKFKLRELLLLLLRILIIIFLVLSISKPVIYKRSGNIDISKRKSIIFVIDNSISMSAISKNKSLLDKAKELCKKILTDSSQGDKFSVILTSGINKILFSEFITDKKILLEKINEIKTSYIKNNIFEALTTADKLLKTDRNNKKFIYLISDFQKINFFNEDGIIKNKYINIKYPVLMFNVSDREIKNSSIIENKLPGVLKFKSDIFPLKAKIKNFSEEPNNLIVKLFIENNAYNQKSITIKSKNTIFVNFRNKINKSGILYGYTEITDGDNLTLDNKNYFVFKIPDTVKVSIIEDNKNLFYVLSALSPINMINKNYDTDIQFYIMNKLKYKDTDLLIVGKNSYTKNDFLILKKYIINKKSIIIFLPPDLNYNSFNENILKKGIINGSIIGIGENKKNVSLEQIDFDHPIFSIFENLKVFKNITISKFFKINISTDDINKRVLARFSNGYPAIIEYTPITDINRNNDSKIILFLFTPYKETSNIIYNPNFPPLINQIVKYVINSSNIDLMNNFKCGITIDDIKNILDINSENKIKCLTGKVDKNIISGVIVKPGVYQIDNYKFAVNEYINESDLEYIKLNVLTKNYRGIKFIDSEINNNFIYNTKLNIIHLWKLFLFIAFLLLIIEFIVANYEVIINMINNK